MCGLSGFCTARPAADRDAMAAVAKAMADAVAHRGPDDSGVWVDADAGIALGHRRLSIVDLSQQGHQPMASASGRYVTAYNGEIYNFGDLRRELSAGGHSFRGHSDTEVLLVAVEQWGLRAAVERFVGMFAFALWDRVERRLHLVRDRMGEKPLYYGWIGQTFLFGSELKALRANPCWRGEVSRDALTLFLRFNYVPAPYSIYEGIAKVPPGTIVTIDPRRPGEMPDPVSYWSAREWAERGAEQPFAGSPEDAADQLEALLKDAIRQQMIADVPLGAFLSGGVDSSTIVALMQVQSSLPVKTFTIGFVEQEYNEAQHAKLVAQHLGTDHTELYVTPSEAMDVIPSLPSLYDEPFADSSQIPTHLVSRLARQHVTVSLSGDGGDELFGGYNRYLEGPRIWDRVKWAPQVWRSAAASAVMAISPGQWDRAVARVGRFLPGGAPHVQIGNKASKLAKMLRAEDPHGVYTALVSIWPTPEKVVVRGSEPRTVLDAREQWPRMESFAQRMMYLDAVTYLPDDVLAKVDRAAMGVSLESRVPLLDHRVVEFAWRLPVSMKVKDGRGKWLLRQVLHRYVPRELIERPKMGFAVPVGEWIRGPLRSWAEELLDERRLRDAGYLDPVPVRSLWQQHIEGTRNAEPALWGVLMFQAWLESLDTSALPA